MHIDVPPGKYVVAVSGGVDSVVLLHLLSEVPNLKLLIAHLDHGIRGDSIQDRQLVQGLAGEYKLPFVYERIELGEGASEAVARAARYDFLRHVQKASGSHAIITAHHEDDVLETAILNLLRGTKRKGITSLRSHEHLLRPLLHVPKQDIRDYAATKHLTWREDSTNQDVKYIRNYVRHRIIPRLPREKRREFLDHITRLRSLNHDIDTELHHHLHFQPAVDMLNRKWFLHLPHDVALEVMAEWLRKHKVHNLNRKRLEQLVVGAKTLKAGKKLDVDKLTHIFVTTDILALKVRDR